MNRRAFLASLASVAGALTLDPEKLLWVPGRKLISIPATPPVSGFTTVTGLPMLAVGDVVEINGWPNKFVVIRASEGHTTMLGAQLRPLLPKVDFFWQPLNPSRNADHGRGVSWRPVEVPVR